MSSTLAIQFAVVASALNADARQAMRQSRQLGFAGLQFDAWSPTLHMTDLGVTGRREFRHLLASQDQQLVGLRAELGKKGFSPGADVDRLLQQLDQAMEASVELGAPLLCVDLGPLPAAPVRARSGVKVTLDMAGLILLPNLPVEAPPEEPAVVPDPKFISQLDAALADLGRRADRYAVMLAFRSEMAGFSALSAALNRVACPWFGIDLDPPALLCDRWNADEIFSRLGPSIRHVRGRDANVGAERRVKSAAVGRGDTDWAQLLANLDASEYAGWLTLDPMELTDRAGAAASGLEQLRRIVS